MLNGSLFVLYLDNDQLLLSKSNNISFNGETNDISTKIPIIISFDNSSYWESTNINWESADFTWDQTLYQTSHSGWKEVMMGMRSGSFSAEGLLEVRSSADGLFWQQMDYNWNSYEVNWDDAPKIASVSSVLDQYLIQGTKLKFDLMSDGIAYFSGDCYVNQYEVVANNEDVVSYNADFNITGVTE
jgi:hypothetical protein|tara:strand:- start:5712 stop:6269 length:558 start_codon:yes stop_codon:yes gene_type:complete